MTETHGRPTPADPLFRVIVATTAALGAALAGLVLSHESTPALPVVPLFIPISHGFIAMAAASVAFVALGRHRVLRDPVSYWTGIALALTSILSVFYLLSWPGLRADGGSLIAHLPGAATWNVTLGRLILGALLIVAVTARWPGPGALAGRAWGWSVAGWLAPAALVGFLLVVCEARLPALIDPAGHQQPLLMVIEGLVLLLFAAGIVLATRAYRRSREELFGYVALLAVWLTYSALTALMAGHRYSLLWYVSRFLTVAGMLTVLFGLLWEYVRLYRREQQKSLDVQATAAALAEQSNLMQSMIQHAPAGLALYDGLEQVILWHNPAYTELLDEQWHGGSVVGLSLEEAAPGAEELGVADLHRAVAAGQPQRFPEYEFRGFRRGVTYYNWNAIPVPRADGRGYDVLTMAVDVTDQVVARQQVEASADEARQAQQLAQQRTQELDTIINSIADGVMIYDREGNAVRTNGAFRTMANYTAAEMALPLAARRDLLDLRDAEGRSLSVDEAPAWRAIQGETITGFPMVLFPGTDREVITSCSAAPLRNAGGEITGAVVSVTDITCLKAAQAVAESRATELATTIRTMADGVVILDPAGMVMQSNDAAERLFRWSEEEQKLRWVERMAGREARNDSGECIAIPDLPASRALVGEVVNRVTMCFWCGADEELWLLVHGAPLYSAEGVLGGAVLTFTDITELKHIQTQLKSLADDLQNGNEELAATNEELLATTEELQAALQSLATSEERYRTIGELLPQGIWSTDARGAITYVSDAMLRLTGLTFEEYAGFKWTELLPDGEREEFVSAWLEGSGAGDFWSHEYRVRGLDGQYHWILARGVPQFDASGRLLGYLGVNVDIDDLKAVQEELARHRDQLDSLVRERTAKLTENERKYRELVENARSAILRWNREGTIEFANEYAEKLFGYEPGELSGKPITILAPPTLESGMTIDDLVVGILSDPKRFEVNENENLTKSGELLWLAWSNRAINDAHGNLTAIMAIGVDRTEQHRAELELERFNRVNAVLTQANEAIIRIHDRRELFHEICRIAVVEGRFRMAWIGTLDPATSHVVPETHWGQEEGYLEAIRVTAMQDAEGHGPTGTAVREGVYQVCNDIANDPRMAPWAEEAERRGYRSSGAFPFQADRTTGALTIYSEETNFFDEQRIRLLQALAIDLAIALQRDDAVHELQAHQRRLRQLATDLALTEQRERQAIATWLHDDVAQVLALAKMKVGFTGLATSPEEVRSGLADISKLLGEAIHSTRNVNTELSPPILFEQGLAKAIEWAARRANEHHGVKVSASIQGQIRLLNKDASVIIFQAVKELLNNAGKHAEAAHLSVRANYGEDSLRLTIEDDGQGFDPAAVRSSDAGGFGLLNIRERIEDMGGTFTVESGPGQGSRFTLQVPIS